MKFIKFNDSTIDSFLFMMLTDLAKTLTKSEAVEVEYGVQSYYNPFEKKIYMSHFWKDRAAEDMEAGLKSDVYLRSVGTRYSSLHEFANFLNDIHRHLHLKVLPSSSLCCLKTLGSKNASNVSARVRNMYLRSEETCTENISQPS